MNILKRYPKCHLCKNLVNFTNCWACIWTCNPQKGAINNFVRLTENNKKALPFNITIKTP